MVKLSCLCEMKTEERGNESIQSCETIIVEFSLSSRGNIGYRWHIRAFQWLQSGLTIGEQAILNR